MFKRICSENQCVYIKGYNSSVWKDKRRNAVFIKIGQQFQCVEG